MFYAVTTRNGFDVTPHATEEQAAQHLIDSLNGDHAADFWIEDGRLIQNSASRLDFTFSVYEGHGELIEAIAYMDNPVEALRAIAAAIEIAEGV